MHTPLIGHEEKLFKCSRTDGLQQINSAKQEMGFQNRRKKALM